METLIQLNGFSERGLYRQVAYSGTKRLYLLGIRDGVTSGSVTLSMSGGSSSYIISNEKPPASLNVNAIYSLVAVTATSGEAQYAYWPNQNTDVGTGCFVVLAADNDAQAVAYAEALVITAPTSRFVEPSPAPAPSPVPAPAPSPEPAPAPAAMTQEQFWREMLAEMRKQTELMQTSPQRIAQASAEAGAETLEWTRKQAFMSECIIAAYSKDSDVEDVMAKADELYAAGITKIEQVGA